MKVVLYVMNSLQHDSRVIREARSLAAAGHEVTVMTTTSDPSQRTGLRETRDGFTQVRVAVPRHWPLWYTVLAHPWRLARRVRTELAAIPRRPARVVQAVAFGALLLGLVPWIALLGGWTVVQRLGLRRPWRPGVLDYLLRWRVFYLGWAAAAVAHAPPADVHHANDMDTLPAALAGARRDGSQVVYDSHEIFLESSIHARQPGWLRWIMRRWERRMAGEAAALITINGVCASELGRRLRPRRIVVLHSCPYRWTPPAEPEDRIRRALAIPSGSPIVLCHGGFRQGRGIPETAAAMAMPGLESAHLVFLGPQNDVVDDVLVAFPDRSRVHFLPPVPPDDVVAWVAGADVDVMVLQPVELNHIVSTPNKLFESIAAGVPVVSSDFPARREIIAGDPDGPLGELCDPTDVAAIHAALRRLLELAPASRADLRRRILIAAHDRWNWETEAEKLAALYGSLGSG